MVSGSLTVRENLFFSAALRLPSKMTQEERNDRVQSVIDDLRLNKCADRKVKSIGPFFLAVYFILTISGHNLSVIS